MAKAPAPTTTRLHTTVNARYYPVEGVADAYCLDGRFPGKRELRAVNNTVDRETRGFLVSVFAYPSDARSRQLAWQEPLKELAGQLAIETGDIDTDINDLAEAALDVTGGLKLTEETARAPYFAGVILRDGEMAAVTVGEGLALIFRQDVLYPLTGQSARMEPIDLYGDTVEGLEDFIAGEAGAIRYSNIAQVEEGDVIVLCNGELFDVIGQKEFMKHLSEAEDPMDAAGLLMTAAASQMPGTPIQVTVSKVDTIHTIEQASKFSLGRFATQAMEPVIAPPMETAEPGLASTQRYERQDMVDRARRLAPEPDEEDGADGWALPPLPPVSEATEPFEAVTPGMGHQAASAYDDYQDDYAADAASGWDTLTSGGYHQDAPLPAGDGELPVFAYSAAAQKRSRGDSAEYGDDYDRQGSWETGDDLDRPHGDYDPYGDYDDFDDGYTKRRRRPDGRRRLVFYAILLAIIVVCIVALIKLLTGGKKTPVETDPTTTAPLIIPPVTTTLPPTDPPETTTEQPTEPQGQTHIVVAGDTWWGICLRYYDRASETLCERLAEYNDMSVSNLYVGNKVVIPPLAELLGD